VSQTVYGQLQIFRERQRQREVPILSCALLEIGCLPHRKDLESGVSPGTSKPKAVTKLHPHLH
jgi:hypothetical protein